MSGFIEYVWQELHGLLFCGGMALACVAFLDVTGIMGKLESSMERRRKP